jgi:hypothetical protein
LTELAKPGTIVFMNSQTIDPVTELRALGMQLSSDDEARIRRAVEASTVSPVAIDDDIEGRGRIRVPTGYFPVDR